MGTQSTNTSNTNTSNTTTSNASTSNPTSNPAWTRSARWGARTLAAAALAAATALTVAPAVAQTAPDASATVRGRAVLNEVLDAHGGEARFRSFGALRYHTDGLPYSANAPLIFDHVADLVTRSHRMDGSSAKGDFIAAANASKGWTTNADALGIPPHWVNHGNSYFVLMPFVFSDPGVTARWLGERTFDGQTFDAISVGFASGVGDTSDDDYVLYIDQATRRLRLIDFTVTYGPILGDTPVDQAPRRSLEFVEWQRVDGVLIPKVLHYAPWERTETGGKRKEAGVRYEISAAAFDRSRPDPNLFQPPAGVAWDE